jgi:two-component system, response regulator YesN
MSRILVIDDDLGTRQTFDMFLRRDGWVVMMAADGRDGLALARSGPLDVALIDIRLPDMTGMDILRLLRDELPRIQCIMMTAFGSIASAVDAMKLGAWNYLEKPLADTQLLQAARAVLDGNRPINHVPEAAPASERVIDGHRDWRVVAALQLIDQYYERPEFSLSLVARELAVSVEHICRLLKRDTGTGFQTHLHRVRISAAKHLLQHTNLSVKEIACRAGYTTTTRLDHCFRRLCGVLPSEFRQGARGGISRRAPTSRVAVNNRM